MISNKITNKVFAFYVVARYSLHSLQVTLLRRGRRPAAEQTVPVIPVVASIATGVVAITDATLRT